MEERRNVGENSCNSGDGTDQTGSILYVYDDDDDDIVQPCQFGRTLTKCIATQNETRVVCTKYILCRVTRRYIRVLQV